MANRVYTEVFIGTDSLGQNRLVVPGHTDRAPIFICSGCGSIVNSVDRHNQWHNNVDRIVDEAVAQAIKRFQTIERRR